MNLKSALLRNIGGLVLAVAATQSWAGAVSIVGLSGEVGFSCGTGTGGFEQHCSEGENVERGGFHLEYAPLTRDMDSSDSIGFFKGAISSFSMTVSQINRPSLTFSLVGRGDIYRGGMWPEWVTWSMILKEENHVVKPSRFSFNMYGKFWEDPNDMPTADFWSTVTGFVAEGAGVSETDWLNGGLNVYGNPRPIPVPGSLWLLFIGSAGIFLRWGRLRKS